MASLIYDVALREIVTGGINFANDIFDVILASADYRPDKAGHAVRDDIARYEIKGRGYQIGGKRVDIVVSQDGDAIDIELGGQSWPNSTLSARYAIYSCRDVLIAAIEFPKTVASHSGMFSLTASTLRFRSVID